MCSKRGMWVAKSGCDRIGEKEEENEVHGGYGTSIQPALGDATPGDTHVTSIMTGYYLIFLCKGRACDFQRRTNDTLPLMWR